LSVNALGLGGYAFYETTFGIEEPRQEIKTYWVREDNYFPPVSITEVDLPSMENLRTVSESFSLYVMFNCYVLTNAAD